MKKIYLVFTLISFSLGNAQIVNIPDQSFKYSLLNYHPTIDTNHDNQIQVSEALAVTTIDFLDNTLGNYLSAQDLTGLEAFTNLTTLRFYSTAITSFDFSGMTHLQTLEIPSCNNLTSLNINGLTNLQHLDLSSNPSTNLDLSAFTNLQSLKLAFCNSLTSLNISGLTNLQDLDLSNSYQLPSLNLTGFANLRNVKLDGCYVLSSLSLNGTTALETFSCNGCYDLTSLDLSGRTNLTSVQAAGCGITSLNLTGSTNLQSLDCHGNDYLGTLNLTGLSQLRTVICYNSSLISLITTGANNITHLDCHYNHLPALNLTGLNHLETLNCSDNRIAALPLTGLTALTSLECSYNAISSLDLSQVPNLVALGCYGNALTSLTLTPLANTLTSLNCGNNALPNVDFSDLVHLAYLGCYNTGISSLTIGNLVQLTELNCGLNNLTSLNIANNTALERLSCDGNHLTTLDITHQPNLNYLNCGSNLLTSLDFSNSHRLGTVYAASNLFSTIDLSQSVTINNGYFDYNFTDNPNLTQINMKNGNPVPGSLDASGCPLLRFICIDDIDGKITPILSMLDYYNMLNRVSVNSYCSFYPGGVHNTIAGTITLDNNNNGCDANDIHPSNFRLNIDYGTEGGATFSLPNGNYSFYVPNGNFTLSPNFNNPYFTISPATSVLNFANLDGSTQTQDYCITANGIHPDLDITIISVTNNRPGFDASYVVYYKNKGNQILSGNVSVTYDDATLDFITATPPVDSQSTNTLLWNYSNLLPFETRSVEFTVNLNGPMETPPLNDGDFLHFTASVTPVSGDETPNDNTAIENVPVRNSFDPNDKTCLQGNTMTPAMVGGYLDYVVRFQNTGSYFAQNVVVKDDIDPTKFDISSLELVGSSHPMVTRIKGNKAEFIFENINLPASVDDEPGSHGYVAFKIKTKNNLVLGNNVQNTADIYFDFNYPVVTNTTSTIVALLNVAEHETNSVSITPIPVTDLLQIKALDTITCVQLFDIQGRLLQTKFVDGLSSSLDFTGKSNGVYLVKVYTSKGMKVQKVIKK